MSLSEEARSKIADIIYHLNVEPDEVDAVVDEIAEAVGPQGITIDLAGAMDKITPEMIDQTRDLMIDALTRRCKELREALHPFADRVYKNPDITVEDTHLLTHDDFVRAYHAYKG